MGKHNLTNKKKGTETVYCISGLGADERLFQFIDIDAKKKAIKWIKPYKNENLREYAKRLEGQIEKNSKIILIGVSFGGIVAIELSKILNPELTIIVSSIKNEKELPLYLRVIGKLKLHKLVPVRMLHKSDKIMRYFFGIEKEDESKLLLKDMLKKTDSAFIKWSIDQILKWKNEEDATHLFHIHGTHDRIFPVRKINGATQIQEGTHLMIVNKATEISTLLNEKISR